jgi:sugar/nucleoside kinase (ribokinase family)
VDAVPELVCIGRIVKEMIYFPGQVRGPVLGSPPAYSSVASSRQGTATGIVTKIGPDMSNELLQPLLQSGVNTAGILLSARSTASELFYDGEGNKEIRYPSMSDSLRKEDIPLAFRGCGLIYVCPMDEDVLLDDMADVVASGQLSAVDLGGYGGVHMSKARRQAFPSLLKLAREVAAQYDIVKASDEDTVSIFGSYDPAYAAQKLLECGPDVVIITLGKKGALVCTTMHHWLVPPVPGNVMDTTGGGDTFMAGFLSEYLRSGDPLQSGRWGCATATCVIEQSGGVRLERMPTRHLVQARFNQTYK